MIVQINRTSRILELPRLQNECCVRDVAKRYGFQSLLVSDIENADKISWEGIEFNHLYIKDGIVYRFSKWTGEKFPYTGIELEEIGFIPERIIAK